MVLLKENGSLDVERIDKLPLEEYMNAMGDLRQEQVKKYISKLPINDNATGQPLVYVFMASLKPREFGLKVPPNMNESRNIN